MAVMSYEAGPETTVADGKAQLGYKASEVKLSKVVIVTLAEAETTKARLLPTSAIAFLNENLGCFIILSSELTTPDDTRVGLVVAGMCEGA